MSAYQRGFKAQREGRPIGANPYKRADLREQWCKGWCDASEPRPVGETVHPDKRVHEPGENEPARETVHGFVARVSERLWREEHSFRRDWNTLAEAFQAAPTEPLIVAAQAIVDGERRPIGFNGAAIHKAARLLDKGFNLPTNRHREVVTTAARTITDPGVLYRTRTDRW